MATATDSDNSLISVTKIGSFSKLQRVLLWQQTILNYFQRSLTVQVCLMKVCLSFFSCQFVPVIFQKKIGNPGFYIMKDKSEKMVDENSN